MAELSAHYLNILARVSSFLEDLGRNSPELIQVPISLVALSS